MADQSIIDALFGGPSWLERANQERLKAQAAYLQGGPVAMMQDTSGIQGLAGGFAGTTMAKGTPVYNRSLMNRLAAKPDPEEALHNYDYRSQREWLGGQEPPKNGKLTIYRATPEGGEIRPGDYVTNSKEYAQLHIDSNLGGEGKITSITANLDELHPADGPKEFWYYPKSEK